MVIQKICQKMILVCTPALISKLYVLFIFKYTESAVFFVEIKDGGDSGGHQIQSSSLVQHDKQQ